MCIEVAHQCQRSRDLNIFQVRIDQVLFHQMEILTSQVQGWALNLMRISPLQTLRRLLALAMGTGVPVWKGTRARVTPKHQG